MDFHPSAYRINDFIDWNKKGVLILSPKFQRRSVWSTKAKSFLIDTILRGLPIPIIFMRENIDIISTSTRREIVDGQQRLRAIIDYATNKLSLYKVHNKDYGGKLFKALPEAIQRKFLNYQLSVVIIGDADDEIILDIFARLNSYTQPLNKQELLNAKYNGAFKQFIYNLARGHLEFWRINNIFTSNNITRMLECEFVSELIIAMLAGIQDKKNSIKLFYSKYDDEFLEENIFLNKFEILINLISSIWDGDSLSRTPWRRRPLFYSLFLGFFDLIYGLPNSPHKLEKRYILRHSKYPQIRQHIEALGDVLDEENPEHHDDCYTDFINATARQTDNINPRSIRHKFIVEAILSAIVSKR